MKCPGGLEKKAKSGVRAKSCREYAKNVTFPNPIRLKAGRNLGRDPDEPPDLGIRHRVDGLTFLPFVEPQVLRDYASATLHHLI